MSDAAGAQVARQRVRGHGRRWLRIVLALLCVALGGLGGLAVHRTLPTEYTASVTLLVLPTATGLDSSVAGSRSAAEVQIETEAELLQSAQVAAAASERLDGTVSARDLLRNSSLVVPPNSQVLVVSLSSTTPERARDGSMALAVSYLDRRAGQAADEIATVVESLESQLGDLTDRLKETSAALADVPTDNVAQRLLVESQRSLLVDQVADVNSRLVALRIQSAPGGEIVSEAQLPESRTSPNLLFTVGAGLLIGALAAGGLLLALSQLRARRRVTSEEVAPTRVPVLATLALSHPPTAGVGTGPDVFRFVDEDEVVRRLCMKISTYKGAAGPIVIVGVGDALLRTRVATSLNQAWAAEFGSSVLVLTEDGDHVEAAGIPASTPGLRDALRGERSIIDTATVPVGTYAGVVGPGRDAHLAPTASQRGLLPEAWTALERDFGAVMVQTGSPLDSPLAQSVAQTAGRFIVLVEVGVGQRRDLTSTLEEIEWLDLSDRVAGVVIVSNHPAPSLTEKDLADVPVEPRDRGAQRDPNVSGALRDRG